MKNLMLSIFTLLLFAAAATTPATVHASNPKLAVFVVGMNDWMIGDVLAHLVGEELNRGKTYDVVTRRNDVQNKLEALRRGYDSQADYPLCAWATEQGINTLCLVTTTSGLNFSLKLLDVSSGEVHCSGSSVEPNAVALKQLAWSLTGSIGDACTSSGPWGDYTELLIGMEMVYVEGGTFTMGCVSGRDDRNGHSCANAEKPSHDVLVGDFWIGKYEVTQGQWEAIMGTNIDNQYSNYELQAGGSESLPERNANFPMYYVNWAEAQAFCDMLSFRTGKSYRLATEEEWEYAARGGKWSRGYVYSGSNTIDSVAWYRSNSGFNAGITYQAVHAGGTTKKRGNELGICDMSGNLKEWCADYQYGDYDDDIPLISHRVVRGGGCGDDAWYCRVASRPYNYNPSFCYPDLGFRVV
ncbi:MAG: formylglycine-generating enzyme family protein [Prevotellaceae bacterium]|jgi:formylglycine-generating enzyme required for sulfatase activity|nr:formylglycine-generating enzyme family protein [Prevotellaceae bacterium]